MGLALCAMIGVSFYPALSVGFIWDDRFFAESPAVLSWSGLWTIWFSPAEIGGEVHYWPITYTTFWLEDKLWGIAPFGTHLVNVLLYMVHVLLLWHLLRCLGVPGAWAVAAVFAVHPMHVESVAWAIGRKDLLSGLFCVAATLCWIRAMDGLGESRGDSSGDLRIARPGLYLAAAGLLAAAMLSKSAAVALPFAFVILLWWKRGWVTPADALRVVPFFLVTVGIALADFDYYRDMRPAVALAYGPLDRVLIAGRALWFYVGKLVWPTELAGVYPLWEVDIGDPLAWLYPLAAAAIAALFWLGRDRFGRGPLAGALFFAVMLAPVLGFVDFGYMRLSLVADRYAYLAGIGVIAVIVGTAAHVAARLPHVPGAAAAVLAVMLAVFGKLTWDQIGPYRDKISYFSHAISLNSKARVYEPLATALLDAGRLTEALATIRIALERWPDSPSRHNLHGEVLFALERPEEAEDSFRRILELDPDDIDAHVNLGAVRMHQERWAEAANWFREALERDPQDAMAHAGLGESMFRLGRYARAVESLERAVSLQRDEVEIHTVYYLADALRRQRRNEEAIERYRDVLEMDPGFARAHSGIGYLLFDLKRYEESLEWLARSVLLDPDAPDIAYQRATMGQASEALGRNDEAAEHYARALAFDSRHAGALDSLAWLRLRQQRYREALGLYETLIEVDDTNGQAHANMALALRHLDRPEEASRSLARALALDPALVRTGHEAMPATP